MSEEIGGEPTHMAVVAPLPTRIHIDAQYCMDATPGTKPTGTSNISDFILRHFPNEVPNTRDVLKCEVPVGTSGRTVLAHSWGNHIFVVPNTDGLGRWYPWMAGGAKVLDGDPFIQVEVVGQATSRQITTQKQNPNWNWYSTRSNPQYLDVTETHTYEHRRGWRSEGVTVPYAYIPVRISVQGAEPVEARFPFQFPEHGVAQLDPMTDDVTVDVEVEGMKHRWKQSLLYGWGASSSQYREGLSVLYANARKSKIEGPDINVWWQRFFDLHPTDVQAHGADLASLSTTLNKKTIKPNIERLQRESPLDWTFFQWLQSSATSNKQMNNRLLTAFLLKVGETYDTLLAELRKARLEVAPTTSGDRTHYGSTDRTGQWAESRRAICIALPGASDKVQEVEAKADWRKAKDNGAKADGLGVTQEKHPLLRAALESGKIPTTVFNQPNGQPINMEFAIWEKSLANKGWADVISEIALDAGRRGTYERDITSYLSFLPRICKYLDKHAPRGKGKKWTAIPKYVESQWELEVNDTDNENGTSSKRSAFTPVADNDAGTITVPYVAVCVSGVRTQWCYARHYHLFEEGFLDPISDGVVVNDFETKLNGRDDYGLCFYTLTGTVTARGYPTFLIIFERREKRAGKDASTFVHFHRVRPQRSKDGKTTPACQLVEACYQYMAGNVPAKDIAAQQGDMIYILHPGDPLAAGAKVDDPTHSKTVVFESHQMVSSNGVSLSLYRNKAKTPANRLGFINAPAGMDILHPEHDHIMGLPPGWYEIRRCKSWEANPQAIWTYTCD